MDVNCAGIGLIQSRRTDGIDNDDYRHCLITHCHGSACDLSTLMQKHTGWVGINPKTLIESGIVKLSPSWMCGALPA